MDIAILIAAWVFAVLATTGMSIVVSRGTRGDDINVPIMGGVPIMAPILALVGAVIHVVYALRNPIEQEFAGAIYPLIWGGVASVMWLVAALLTRGRNEGEEPSE